MRQINVRVYDLADTPPREEQLAWLLAACASDKSPVDPKALEKALTSVTTKNQNPEFELLKVWQSHFFLSLSDSFFKD